MYNFIDLKNVNPKYQLDNYFKYDETRRHIIHDRNRNKFISLNI